MVKLRNLIIFIMLPLFHCQDSSFKSLYEPFSKYDCPCLDQNNIPKSIKANIYRTEDGWKAHLTDLEMGLNPFSGKDKNEELCQCPYNDEPFQFTSLEDVIEQAMPRVLNSINEFSENKVENDVEMKNPFQRKSLNAPQTIKSRVDRYVKPKTVEDKLFLRLLPKFEKLLEDKLSPIFETLQEKKGQEVEDNMKKCNKKDCSMNEQIPLKEIHISQEGNKVNMRLFLPKVELNLLFEKPMLLRHLQQRHKSSFIQPLSMSIQSRESNLPMNAKINMLNSNLGQEQNLDQLLDMLDEILTTTKRNSNEYPQKLNMNFNRENATQNPIKNIQFDNNAPILSSLEPANSCDDFDQTTQSCWIQCSLGDKIDLLLKPTGLTQTYNVSWQRNIHRDHEHPQSQILTTASPPWNIELLTRGLRISPVTDTDIHYNTFTAKLVSIEKDSSGIEMYKPISELNFIINIVPIELVAWPYVTIPVEEFLYLPNQNERLKWYLETPGNLNNMCINKDQKTMYADNRKNEKPPIVSAIAFKVNGEFLAKRRFVIFSSELNKKNHKNISKEIQNARQISEC